MIINSRHDFGQLEIYSPFCFAIYEESKLTKMTILILLTGISIAAIMGESVPCTAKDKATIL